VWGRQRQVGDDVDPSDSLDDGHDGRAGHDNADDGLVSDHRFGTDDADDSRVLGHGWPDRAGHYR
jgi:hypothetical protein